MVRLGLLAWLAGPAVLWCRPPSASAVRPEKYFILERHTEKEDLAHIAAAFDRLEAIAGAQGGDAPQPGPATGGVQPQPPAGAPQWSAAMAGIVQDLTKEIEPIIAQKLHEVFCAPEVTVQGNERTADGKLAVLLSLSSRTVEREDFHHIASAFGEIKSVARQQNASAPLLSEAMEGIVKNLVKHIQPLVAGKLAEAFCGGSEALRFAAVRDAQPEPAAEHDSVKAHEQEHTEVEGSCSNSWTESSQCPSGSDLERIELWEGDERDCSGALSAKCEQDCLASCRVAEFKHGAGCCEGQLGDEKPWCRYVKGATETTASQAGNQKTVMCQAKPDHGSEGHEEKAKEAEAHHDKVTKEQHAEATTDQHHSEEKKHEEGAGSHVEEQETASQGSWLGNMLR